MEIVMTSDTQEYKRLRATVRLLLSQEQESLDPCAKGLVDETLQCPDWFARGPLSLSSRVRQWLGKNTDFASDPRTSRYVALRRLDKCMEGWRQADPWVGGPVVYGELTQALKYLPELGDYHETWVSKVEGPASPRDPGCGTGHREW